MNARFTSLFILLLSTTTSYGQINSSLDVIGGIEYSFRNQQLPKNPDPNLPIDLITSLSEGDEGKLNWRFGLNYNRRLTDRLFFKTGARLASVGFKNKFQTDALRWGTQHDGNGGWDLTADSGEDISIWHVYNYWFLEVPVALRYETRHRRFTPFFEVGVSPSVYLTTRGKTTLNGNTETGFTNGRVFGFNRVALVGFASFGANYNINEKLQLFGQPIFRYHFTKLADRPVGIYLFNYGLELGVRRKLN